MVQRRVSGISAIFENIKYILSHILDILVNTCNLFPKGLFLGIVRSFNNYCNL